MHCIAFLSPSHFAPLSPSFSMKIATHHKRKMALAQGLFSLFLMFQNSHAYQFKIGGSGDWSLAASSNYDQWAQRSRFQIGDTVWFNYQANEDSVLQVSENDYKNCNTASPIAKYSDGHTMIKLNQSGPHYFISGVVDHCKNNEKVVIVVLADRSNRSSQTPSPSPPPASPPPAPTSEEIPSPPPAPGAPEPELTPAPTPSSETPPPSHKNGASSAVVNSVCSFAAVAGLSLLLKF